MARVQRARARARGGPGPAAARAGEVPRDLQPEPRRVLRGAGIRARGAAPRRCARHVARRSRSGRAAPRASGARPTTSCSARRPSSPRTSRPRSRRRASGSPTGPSSTTPTGPSSARCSTSSVFPVLTPLAVDPAHPFPYISNLSLNLAVLVRDPTTGEDRFARVKVPPLLPRFIPLPDGERFLPLEQLIAARLDSLFPGMDVVGQHPFRVTRDADFDLEDEDEDLLEAIESVLHRRSKFGRVVRLEIDTTMSPEVARAAVPRARDRRRRRLRRRRSARPLRALGPLRPRPSGAEGRAVDSADPAGAGPRRGQRATSSGSCSRATCSCTIPTTRSPRRSRRSSTRPPSDPHVLAIKQTIYRTAGPDSAIVRSLVKAAKDGKQVVALVELKARFDEQANIDRARVLEEAGVHIVYGLVGLKTHAKIMLVVRQEADGIHRYCHVGTGQLQPEDRRAVRGPRAAVRQPRPRRRPHPALQPPHRLQPARCATESFSSRPESLRSALAERVRREGAKGSAGRIVMKMNSLVDPDLIDELYAASQAGTPIDLIVRGICCLRPAGSRDSRRRSGCGVSSAGTSSTPASTASAPTPRQAECLIGSADLMPRNLDRRVEALVPIDDHRLRARIDEIMRVEPRRRPARLVVGARRYVASHRRRRVASTPQIRLQEIASRGRVRRDRPGTDHWGWGSGSGPGRAELRAGRPGQERRARGQARRADRVPASAAHRPARPGVIAGIARDSEMTATYYDTADLRLTRAGRQPPPPHRRGVGRQAARTPRWQRLARGGSDAPRVPLRRRPGHATRGRARSRAGARPLRAHLAGRPLAHAAPQGAAVRFGRSATRRARRRRRDRARR